MVVSLVGIDGNNNVVRVDDSAALNVSLDQSQYNAVEISAFPHVVKTQDEFHTAIWEGRAFSAGTGIQKIDQDTVLSCLFVNPVDSGKNALVDLRVAGGGRSATARPLQAGFVNNPAPMADPTIVTPANLNTGGNSSDLWFGFQVAPERINTDPPTVGEPTGFFIPNGGIPYRIETPRVISPGNSAGIFVRGNYNQSASKDVVFVTFVWYEEDV